MPLDLDKAIAQLRNCDVLDENEVRVLCEMAKEILARRRVPRADRRGSARADPLGGRVRTRARASREAGRGTGDGEGGGTPAPPL